MVDSRLISVIVSVYNTAGYLKNCIDSIINQAYTNIEIILVDDGSEDDSGKICDCYAQTDSRIYVIHKENGGLISARKAGLISAKGDYIIFVDGDGWINEDMLQALLKKAVSVNADVVDSAYFYRKDKEDVVVPLEEADYQLCIDQTKLIIENWLSDSEHVLISHHICTKLYRADAIKKSYAEIPDDMEIGEEIINYIAMFKYVDKLSVLSSAYYHYNHQKFLLSGGASVGNLRKLNEILGFSTRKIENEYPYISKSKLDIWYLRKAVFQFRQICFGDEWDTPIYKCKNVEAVQNCKLVIYGAGNVGKDIYAQLSKYESCKIVGWVDKDYQNHTYSYYKVKSPDELNGLEYDILLIAVLREKLANSIRDELIIKGINEKKIIWLPIEKLIDNIKSTRVNCNIIRLSGGLGNQMFQYAFYRSMQERGIKVKVNVEGFELEKRNFELPIFPKLQLEFDEGKEFDNYKKSFSYQELYIEKEHGIYNASLFGCRDTSFIGYWQSEKFFKNIEDKIRDEFTFTVNDNKLLKIAKEISTMENAISIHIRRGDYLEVPEMYGGICTVDYYKKAIQYIKQHVASPQFFAFSDDKQWVRDNLSLENTIYVEASMFDTYYSWYDMYLMSCCKHNIIANSSFSWWGAWLNSNPNKIVVAPRKWLNNEDTEDIWCEGWVKI